ncbi:MAG: hypothetical protein EPO21_04315 [Chloroflexota bacterium]|nr:MAG: hypothetical protein EPO21_04315 [Chloroflexota bacterium]
MRRAILAASGGVVLLGVLGLLVFGTAFARSTVGKSDNQQIDSQEQRDCHDGSDGQDAILGALAKALGTSESQLQSDVEAGKSLREIARARGLDEQELSTAIRGAIQEALKQQIDEGSLSQAEAESMLKHVEQMGPDHFIPMMDRETHGTMMNGEAHGTMMDEEAPDTMMDDAGNDTTEDTGDSCHVDATAVI